MCKQKECINVFAFIRGKVLGTQVQVACGKGDQMVGQGWIGNFPLYHLALR